jgi:hypothetical protein
MPELYGAVRAGSCGRIVWGTVILLNNDSQLLRPVGVLEQEQEQRLCFFFVWDMAGFSFNLSSVCSLCVLHICGNYITMWTFVPSAIAFIERVWINGTLMLLASVRQWLLVLFLLGV